MTNIKRIFHGIYGYARGIDIRHFSLRSLDRSKLITPFRLFRHPIDTFNDMKYEGDNSLAVANLMLILFFVTEIIVFPLTGYLFTNNDISKFSIIAILTKTIVPVLLWTVCNWATCTLLEGEGTFRQIWIATCYSLIPLVLCNIPIALLSNILTISESSFYSTCIAGIQIWTAILLFVGMMVTHQFSASKTVGSVVLTIGMILIATFFALLAVSIYQQLLSFINTVFTEISIR